MIINFDETPCPFEIKVFYQFIIFLKERKVNALKG